MKKKKRGRSFYLTTNYGAAELAKWLTQKGFMNVSYLVGGADLFYEYIINENLTSGPNKFLMMHSGVHFITPSLFCNQAIASKNSRIIDLRHDTLFNKITKGAKHNYKHLKEAVNFFAGKRIQRFEQEFPAKKIDYVFISEDGIDRFEFADTLQKRV